MKLKIPGVLICLLTAAGIASAATAPAIIPLPQKMARHEGAFKLTPDTRVYVDAASRATADFLTERLRRATGYPLKISKKSAADAIPGVILLTTKNANTNLGAE